MFCLEKTTVYGIISSAQFEVHKSSVLASRNSAAFDMCMIDGLVIMVTPPEIRTLLGHFIRAQTRVVMG